MTKKLVSCWLVFVALVAAAVPTPGEHFGFTPGDDYKLASYAEIYAYFQKLAKSSDRIKVFDFGRSSEGRPMLAAIISSPENLKRLDYFRSINRKLALGEVAATEAKKLASEGKVFVWIDAGIHSTEVAPIQHGPGLAYRMVTDDSDEFKRFRDKTILIQIPAINPDGADMVAEWYRKNVGTPYELAPLPELYQKYVGHDNNRDWFMMNLPETRHVSRLLFEEFLPQIVYNQHQIAPFPARIFIPPYAEPLNPNIPPPVMEGINLLGSAMKERLSRENKTGAVSYVGFDAWWNGGLRSVPAFHNMHGILTETAGVGYATPYTYPASELPKTFSNGIPTMEPTVFYERPWKGGKWTLRDAVEYNLTCDFAILDIASSRAESFLMKAWEMAAANIEAGKKGGPFAYVIPSDQHDRTAAITMLSRLRMGGIEVRRARAEFEAGGRKFAEGSYVLAAAQPFRGYLIDLMEPQKYPELRSGTTGPTKRPYDLAGWTLPMAMGVKVERIESGFSANLEDAADLNGQKETLDHRDSGAFHTIAGLLQRGVKVRWAQDGKILKGGEATGEEWAQAQWDIRTPRVAVYEPWTGNMDAGWTQWLLDHFYIPHARVRNDEIKKGQLRAKYDTLILAQQTAQSILHGYREGVSSSRFADGPKSIPRPEHTGGIGTEGLMEIERFVRDGGTLLAFDSATEVPLQFLDIGARGLLRGEGAGESATGFYSPGSLLRITVDTSNPIAFGMTAEAVAMSTGGQAFEIDRAGQTKSVAKYADKNLLASGWASGEQAVLGKTILTESKLGKGKVVMYGFRPQFRGQTYGTFKLLLNAIYLASANPLR